jgi:hypothetical protein
VASRMRILCSAVLFIGCLPSSGQTGSVFDLQGVVELVDRPPAATPVEAVSFCLNQRIKANCAQLCYRLIWSQAVA